MKSNHPLRPEPALAGNTPEPKSPGAEVKLPSPIELKRILVPIDFSDGSIAALDYAGGIAKRWNAAIILLHVVEPAAHVGSYLSAPASMDPANQNRVDSASERLRALGRKHFGQGLTVESLVRLGLAHSEIVDTAKAMAADWIVLASHGSTGMKHPIMGSTAERVVRAATCPVLTVPPPVS